MKNINSNFFGSPNLTNSYYAGFLAGDGYISKKSISIQIQVDDIDILNSFKKDIESDHHIGIYDKGGGRKLTCYITFQNKQITKDLEFNFNLKGFNKTFNLEPPFKLSDENFESYLIGLIDADGHIYYRPSSKKLDFGVCGTYGLMEYIKNFITRKYNIALNITKHSSIYRLRISGVKAEYLREILKGIKTPYKLSRKWDCELIK